MEERREQYVMGQKAKHNIEDTQLAEVLGVTKQGDYLVFTVAISNAKECILKLYSKKDGSIRKTIPMQQTGRLSNLFTTSIKESETSSILGYRYEAFGKEFIDPYATKIIGRQQYGVPASIECEDGSKIKGLLGSWDFSEFPWGKDRELHYTYEELILYKLHVRGFTKGEDSGVKHKGTWKGIIEKIPYLKELGINAVFLMPCVELNERIEMEPLLSGIPTKTTEFFKSSRVSYRLKEEEPCKLNYWGYTTDSFYFAPKSSYASEPWNASSEMKQMIKKLHEHGIEVLMEMHFSKASAPTMILDCLHYWVKEYHIDGFRTNLEEPLQQFLAMDPYLGRVKLFATFWNVEGIYGRDRIPADKNLAVYHDGFLVDVRRFLKGEEGQVRNLMGRIRLNSEKTGVINYIADHNGFTLADLYRYDDKHNEANGEGNKDGTEFNYSWNCGTEGETKKRKINELRLQMSKNALMLLFLSQGTPMILQGDEFGNSSQGNNNAYCQDNEIGWINWASKKKNKELFLFVKELIQFRKDHPVLHNVRELSGIDFLSCGCPDISFHGSRAWYPEDSNTSRSLGILLCGAFAMVDKVKSDDSCYIAINAHWEEHEFALPSIQKNSEWRLAFTTSMEKEINLVEQCASVVLPKRTIAVFLVSTVSKP